LAVVIDVDDQGRETCFGNELLVLRGWTWDDQGVYDCEASAAPTWLACTGAQVRLTTLAYEPGEPSTAMIDPADGPLRVAVDPASPAAEALLPNRWVEVTGRFGDPATAACDELGDGFREECEATFIVTDARTLEAPETLAPDAWAIVTVDELRVRSEPRLASLPIDALAAGDRVFIGIGPFAVDGQWWYAISYGTDFATARRTGWPASGYVAAGEAERRFLELAPVTCEGGDAGLAAILELPPHERASCLGDRELQLEGDLVTPELGPDGTCILMGDIPPWEPRWLTFGCGGLQPEGQGTSPSEPLILHAEAGVAAAMVAAGSGPVRVTGHFNDSAAARCQDRGRPPVLWGVFNPPVDDAALVLRCRASFVATRVEALHE